MSSKRVQALARSGQLPAVRVGRRWLFESDRIERLLGSKAAVPRAAALAISARNRLRGRIRSIETEGLMSEITLEIGNQELVAVITRSSVERMKLRVGDEAFAVIKSTEVMLGREEREA
jgi:molybdopterin-binding protein